MEKIFSAAEIAELVSAAVVKGDPGKTVNGVNSLRLAKENELSFLSNGKYLNVMHSSAASVILVPADLAEEPAEGKTLILCENPDKAFTKVCGLFAPAEPVYEMTVSPMAYILGLYSVPRVWLFAN